MSIAHQGAIAKRLLVTTDKNSDYPKWVAGTERSHPTREVIRRLHLGGPLVSHSRVRGSITAPTPAAMNAGLGTPAWCPHCGRTFSRTIRASERGGLARSNRLRFGLAYLATHVVAALRTNRMRRHRRAALWAVFDLRRFLRVMCPARTGAGVAVFAFRYGHRPKAGQARNPKGSVNTCAQGARKLRRKSPKYLLGPPPLLAKQPINPPL